MLSAPRSRRRHQNPDTVPEEARLSIAQIRVMQLLSDGLPHHGITEIKPLLPDGNMNGPKAVILMIHRIRAKLNGTGFTVVCELYKSRIHYRYIKLVSAQPSKS